MATTGGSSDARGVTRNDTPVVAITALLHQLLGTDDAEARQTNGSRLTPAVRAGAAELPSATFDGFMAALACLADDEPAALSTVFWRAATALQPARGERRWTDRHHPHGDRRRIPDVATELRRDIRRLEQETFESSTAQTTAAAVPHASMRSASQWALAACALAMLVLGVGAALPRSTPAVEAPAVDMPGPALAPEPASAPEPALAPEPAPVAVLPAAATLSAVAPEEAAAPVEPRPSRASTAPRRTRQARATQTTHTEQRRRRDHSRRTLAMFPGGPRGFVWAADTHQEE